MEKHQIVESLFQDGAPEELDERKLWKEKLRKEILEEEKKRIMNFVESEVTRKKAEIEKLLEISCKPAKLVFLPKDATHILEKLNLVLEQDNSLSHHLVSASKGISLAPDTLDDGIKRDSELALSSVDSGTKGESNLGVGIKGDFKMGLSSRNYGTKGESTLVAGSKGGDELGLSLGASGTKRESTLDAGSKGGDELGSYLGDSSTKGESTLDAGRKVDSELESLELSLRKSILDAPIKGDSELGFSLHDSSNKGESTEYPPIPVKEAKEQASEEKQQLRPRKKQKTTAGCKWSCPLCGVTATSEINLNNHFMGKKHKTKSSKVQKAMKTYPEDDVEGKERPTNALPMNFQANGKPFVVYKKGGKFWCNNSNCKFTCTELAEMGLHLTGPEHVEMQENGAEGKTSS